MKNKHLLLMLLMALLMPWAANAQTSLWSEDFEDGSMPTGWTTDGNGSWSVATAVNSSHPSSAGHGTYCAQIKHGTKYDATKLITPEIDLSSVTSAELSFMRVNQSWSGDIDALRVYYRTSTSGTWTLLDEFTDAQSNWHTEEGIVLSNLSSTYQIAFEYYDLYGYGLGIDYINIVQGASCVKPAALAVTSAGQSATLTWESDATQWSVAHSTNSAADPSDNVVTTVSSPTYTMNDLALNQDHYFWVRTNCSATEQSAWAGPVNAHVGYCVPAPSSVDNSGISNVTFGTGNYVVNNNTTMSSSATYLDCTNNIGAVQAGVEATIAITFKTGYTYNTFVWVDLDNSLSFDANEVICYGESTSTNPTTLTLNFTIPATQTLGDFRLRIGSADSGLGSDPTAADPCYSNSYGCFQDYTLRVLEAPACMMPTGLALTTDGRTAIATWDGTASTYNIDINGTVTNNVTSPYEFNVELSSTYEVKVQANCGGGELSDWTSAASFTTDACMPEDMCEITLQLTDSYGDGWGGNAIKVVDARTQEVLGQFTISSGFSANYTLAICDQRAIEFQWVLGTGYNNGYPDECSWVILDRNGEEITSGEDASAYTTGQVLTSYTVDCSVPLCFKPEDLAVSNITNESAVITWTAGGENQTSWNLQYKAASETRWTLVEGLTEATYTFVHLVAGTVYEVQIQGNCGSEGLSDWTSSVTFTTALCAPEDMCELSYECVSQYQSWYGAAINVVDAESGVILATWTQNNASTGVTTGTLAVCDGRQLSFEWVAGSYDSYSGVIESYAVYDAEGNEILSGTSAMTRPFTYTVNCPTCFKPTNLEATNVGAESAVLNWEGTSASYVLQYRSAEQNINMAEWHQIGEDVTATATETTYTFDLSDYEGEGYVALRHYNVTNMFYLDVDNITVTDPDGATLVSADGTSIPSDWTNQDVDGDGYTWSTSIITGYFVSQSYDNNAGPLTPDNWLIIPVSNLGGTLSFTAKGQDSNFPSEVFGVFVTTASLTDALEPVAAGNWSDEIVTEDLSYQLTGLTANTPYEWQVKSVCGTDDESTWATSTFKTIELGTKNFVTEGSWNVADNWFPTGVPTIDDKVIISANATVPAGVVATAKKINLNNATLTIQDGGQLKQKGTVEVTIEKNIDVHGATVQEGGWYFIASPLTTTRLTYIEDWSYVNALTGNYDLYAFDPTADLEWINYRSSSAHALFTSGSNNPVLVEQTGYLYANDVEDFVLQFEGATAVESYNKVVTHDFTYDETSTNDFNGFVLVGNPFTCNAYLSFTPEEGYTPSSDVDFYVMNSVGNGFELANRPLNVCEGAFFYGEGNGTITFSTEAPSGKGMGLLDMTVSQNRGTTFDQARIRFGEGFNLKHMSFREGSTKVYIPQDGKDYAVVYSEGNGEMPVNFKAENNGTYTLSFSNENVEFSYLHLIDNMTGNDVDLLQTPSYTFKANMTDYESRFKLVFATGNNGNDDSFAFFSDGNFIISNEGNATLQVIDVNGRILKSENINGSACVNVNAAAGVYMLRLINGNDVKVQKVVVK